VDSVKSTIDSSIQIPTLPGIALKILNAVRDENSSFDALAKVVTSDPMIAAKVLKVANSSFYGLTRKVSSIKQAISILGLNTLKNIALSFVVVESMKGLGESSFDFEHFWKRAVTAAVAAELVSKGIKRKYDEAFVCGLLQDIGIVILYFNKQGEYCKILDEKRTRGVPIDVFERETFGFDHQEVGGAVLEEWGFPPSIVEPIRYHHNNTTAPNDYQLQTHIVQLSDRISAVYHGRNAAQNFQDIKAVLNEEYSIDEKGAQELIDSVAHQSNEVFSSFELKGEGIKPISQILQEANQELTKLNFTYESLAMQYKRDKDKMEELARALEDANKKLRNLALRDELTGLFNQRRFLSALENELERAARYKRPLSLVLMDIDHFKRINDEHGHRAGDVVLREIGGLLNAMARNTDVACRYGGEEFAIICPETDMRSAQIMAERLRKAIEDMAIPLDKIAVTVTVSAGVTEYAPKGSAKTSEDIFDAADKALYESKRNGRNRVSECAISSGKDPIARVS
jgi:diguanylate cyclase (GGDEF)-like protein